jgi:hypothetical protein
VHGQVGHAVPLAIDRAFLPRLTKRDRGLHRFSLLQGGLDVHTQKPHDLVVDPNATSISWGFRRSVKIPLNRGQKGGEPESQRGLTPNLRKTEKQAAITVFTSQGFRGIIVQSQLIATLVKFQTRDCYL